LWLHPHPSPLAKHFGKFSPWAGRGEDFAKERGFQPLSFAELFPSPGKVLKRLSILAAGGG